MVDLTTFREDPGLHIGSVDETSTTLFGGRFAGWALDRTASRPARSFIVASDHGAIQVAPNVNRSDIARRFGPESALCGVVGEIPRKLIGGLFAPRLRYFACNDRRIMTELPVLKDNDQLGKLQILTGHDFFRMVQTPSTRIGDTNVLVHLALHVLSRNQDNYVLGAAAICVLGYRLLDGNSEAERQRAVILDEMKRLLSENPRIDRGLFIRWHTSLRLIAGYLAYQAGADVDAFNQFKDIGSFAIELKRWPQALTNILIGVVITGYLLYERGDTSAAVERWQAAEDLLRYGASVAEFQNSYAYGELGNAVRVAQFAHIAALCAVQGGLLNDASLAPLGTRLDIREVPGPMGNLVSKRQNAFPNKSKMF
ncbi:hypothetical protein [Lichenicola sp.]|uniref:hypothetical protein n=1 Tax=Lichenicola sp. TaxID=2804529 RepID=UPI003B00874F